MFVQTYVCSNVFLLPLTDTYVTFPAPLKLISAPPGDARTPV